MLEFIRSIFRGVYTVILWICLIACLIAGGVVGNLYGHPIRGGVIGLVVGLILDILGGGLVAIFLNIDENIQRIAETTKDLKNILSSIRRQEEKRCKRCGETVNGRYTACPHCGGEVFDF